MLKYFLYTSLSLLFFNLSLAQNIDIQENINLSTKFSKKITPIYRNSKPRLSFNKIDIDVPNGIFLQATKKGQVAIIDQIITSANVTADSIVYEVGPGDGALSREIVKINPKKYVAV